MSPSTPTRLLQSALLERALPGVRHGFTLQLPPEHGLAFVDALRAEVPTCLMDARAPLFTLKQIHSPNLVEFPASAASPVPDSGVSPLPEGDGAVLTRPSGAVAVQTADCVPILAVNAARGEVAAVHAGWRGAAAGILPRLLKRWLTAGATPDAIHLAMGPSIHACCYTVREDCTAAFDPAHLEGAVIFRNGLMYLELTRVLANQARSYGIPDATIDTLPHCTACEGDDGRRPFASYRRDGRPGTPYRARNASFIGFAPAE